MVAINSNLEVSATNYPEFHAYYLANHTNLWCRRMHLVGTAVGVGGVTLNAIRMCARSALSSAATGVAICWLGDIACQGISPTSFRHPYWSMVSNFKMIQSMMNGELPLWKYSHFTFCIHICMYKYTSLKARQKNISISAPNINTYINKHTPTHHSAVAVRAIQTERRTHTHTHRGSSGWTYLCIHTWAETASLNRCLYLVHCLALFVESIPIHRLSHLHTHAHKLTHACTQQYWTREKRKHLYYQLKETHTHTHTNLLYLFAHCN